MLKSRLTRLERRVHPIGGFPADFLDRHVIVYTKAENLDELINQARERGVTGTLIVCPAFDAEPISRGEAVKWLKEPEKDTNCGSSPDPDYPGEP